jgi:hypothetical protein
MTHGPRRVILIVVAGPGMKQNLESPDPGLVPLLGKRSGTHRGLACACRRTTVQPRGCVWRKRTNNFTVALQQISVSKRRRCGNVLATNCSGAAAFRAGLFLTSHSIDTDCSPERRWSFAPTDLFWLHGRFIQQEVGHVSGGQSGM